MKSSLVEEKISTISLSAHVHVRKISKNIVLLEGMMKIVFEEVCLGF